MQGKPDLKKIPTRLLLNWLGYARVSGEYKHFNSEAVDLEEIKAELATREHIPNKKEGQASRRAKAKSGKFDRKTKK